MESTQYTHPSTKSNLFPLSIAIICALAIRFIIYLWLNRAGYFYGIPWDTFSRTALSYYWSQRPYFSPADGYWLPFQFWLVGATYLLLKPLINTSEILIPVAINNLFLIGSMIIIYKFSQQVGGKAVGFIACLLIAIFAGDIFISYTALSEPILVFFLLLASYIIFLFFKSSDSKKAMLAILIAIATLLAASTHYIGWFLVFLVCVLFLPFLISSLRMKDWKLSLLYCIAILICIAMPLAWLINNYLLFGDFLHMTQTAKLAQANYIGQIPITQRIFIPAKVLVKNFPAITTIGVFGVILAILFKRDALSFLIAPAFILGAIWLSTLLAFSAPYQEPRYLVFWSWATIPFVALAASVLWASKGLVGKAATILILGLVITINLQNISNFKNSFGLDVKETGIYAGNFLKQNPNHVQVLIEDYSYAERGVIPVIAGFPERFTLIPNQIKKNQEYFDNYFSSLSYPWLAIVRDKDLASQAETQRLSIQRIGDFYLILPDLK